MVDVATPGAGGGNGQITNRYVPVTNANGDVIGTKVLAPLTNSDNGQVLTDANGNTVGTAAFTQATNSNNNGEGTMGNVDVGGGPNGSPGDPNCQVDVAFCEEVRGSGTALCFVCVCALTLAQVCGAGSIDTCDCSGVTCASPVAEASAASSMLVVTGTVAVASLSAAIV